MFVGERVVVIGAGVSGASAARIFAARGAKVRVTDQREQRELLAAGELEGAGIELRAGGHEPSDLDDATLVYVSPGVTPHAPVMRWVRELGLLTWGELELGARLCDVPYAAVTGTNGKTTTTGLLAACLRAGGFDAVACGNIGLPFPDAAIARHDALVVEASSFQLEQQESFHPKVSVLLNLAPDHLDWHGSREAYGAAKARIFANQERGDTHVGNRDDPEAAAISVGAPCDVVWIGTGDPEDGGVGYRDGELVSRVADGVHELGRVDAERAGYRTDAAAAAAAALSMGVSERACAAGIASFTPGPHRGEVVAVAGSVRFVDNSKATNVHAALAAIEPVYDAVLIAGGRSKGVDLSPLATARPHLRGVVAIGESAGEITSLFERDIPVRTSRSIEEAVRSAFELARPDGLVLLAPACASWDMFRDYVERGERFAEAARSIAEEIASHA